MQKELLDVKINKQIRIFLLDDGFQVNEFTPFDMQIFDIIQEIYTTTLTFTTYDVWTRLFNKSKQQATIESLNAINLSVFKISRMFLKIDIKIIENGKQKEYEEGGTLLSTFEFLPYENGIQYSYKAPSPNYHYLSKCELKEMLQKIIENKRIIKE